MNISRVLQNRLPSVLFTRETRDGGGWGGGERQTERQRRRHRVEGREGVGERTRTKTKQNKKHYFPRTVVYVHLDLAKLLIKSKNGGGKSKIIFTNSINI